MPTCNRYKKRKTKKKKCRNFDNFHEWRQTGTSKWLRVLGLDLSLQIGRAFQKQKVVLENLQESCMCLIQQNLISFLEIKGEQYERES